MDLIETLGIERECRRLLSDYCFFWDREEFENWLSIYDDDMTFETEGGKPIQGKEKMRRSLAKRETSDMVTRHVTADVVIEVQDSNNAIARCTLLFFRSRSVANLPLAPQAISDFAATFINTESGWKIKRRYSRRTMVCEPGQS